MTHTLIVAALLTIAPLMTWGQVGFAAVAVACLLILFVVGVLAKWGSYWLQAYMSDADVSMKSLIVMSFLRIEHRMIVTAKVMARQAGLSIDHKTGMSTARLQAHYLAGGDVTNVVQAMIVAHRAGISLDFDNAAAIDLAGRNVLHAVQTSVTPKVIHCPSDDASGKRLLSAIAKNGVELLVGARVTVRTNLDQLIGGAMEETIIARVGQGIVSAIGSADSHMDVLERPSQISKGTMANGLDSNTAFSIVSIDIADIDVGENIGARLQTDQADADTRIARATAEIRRAEAVAREQQMKAKVAESRAEFVLAEAQVPLALSEAFRAGLLRSKRSSAPSGTRRNEPPALPDRARPEHPRGPGDDKGSAASPFPKAKDERQ
ncbi:MAG: flotillin-like protein FloA [Pirellulaceae bacterium]